MRLKVSLWYRIAVAFGALVIAGASTRIFGQQSRSVATATKQGTKNTRQDAPIKVQYVDVREAAGITFQQDATQTDEKYYLETMGTGVAWLDYDQDGLLDLFFVQSAATEAYKPPYPLRCALYHNNGDGTFTDVTEKAGIGGQGHYGQGVAVGVPSFPSFVDRRSCRGFRGA